MLNEIFPPGFLALEKRNTTSEISKKNETAKNMCGLRRAACDPQRWSLVLSIKKTLPNVNLMKSKIKYWKCTECPCKLC